MRAIGRIADKTMRTGEITAHKMTRTGEMFEHKTMRTGGSMMIGEVSPRNETTMICETVTDKIVRTEEATEDKEDM